MRYRDRLASPRRSKAGLLAMTAIGFNLVLFAFRLARAQPSVVATAPPATIRSVPEEMEVQIKGQFKGRLLVKKIVAPVTMNLEKLQDFPEDRSQKILIEPLPTSQSAEFNARTEIKGHAGFWPWAAPIPEPPFLRMDPPKNLQPPPVGWMFEVLNPEGQTIYRLRSTHEMPDELIWEGKDSEKKFAVTDRLYAAQLTLVGADQKSTVIPGESIVLPAMAYGSETSKTVEIPLDRLFGNATADLSAEGGVMLNRFCSSVRELGLTHLHARISEKDQDLASQREKTLTEALQKSLILSEPQIEHDHNSDVDRGDIAVFWLKLR